LVFFMQSAQNEKTISFWSCYCVLDFHLIDNSGDCCSIWLFCMKSELKKKTARLFSCYCVLDFHLIDKHAGKVSLNAACCTGKMTMLLVTKTMPYVCLYVRLLVGSFIASAQVPVELQPCLWLGERLSCDPAGARNVCNAVHCVL
jgi:hypothetical protein